MHVVTLSSMEQERVKSKQEDLIMIKQAYNLQASTGGWAR